MKRFKINWAIPGLFAMILIIAAVAWMQTQSALPTDPAAQAAQCAACHTMDTHVDQWKDSSHKQVACTACHAEQGVKGWVTLQLDMMRMRDKKDTADLAHIKTEVPNERCMDCHARQMPWVMQDLKPAELDEKGEPIRPAKDQLQFLAATAGHDVHLTMESPLKCTDCHSAVSHGPAPEKREEHVQTMHQICLDCHAQKQVTLNVRNSTGCSACHLDMGKIVPEDHKTTAFRSGHGTSAAKDSTSCTQCHLNTGITKQAASAPHGLVPQLPPGSINVPANATDACATCHGTTMPHPKDFLTGHAKGFNEKPELCASCHGTRDQGFNMTFKGDPRTLSTTDPSCTSCHQQPMPHPEGYLEGGHQSAGKAAPATCQQCHSPSNPANPKGSHATAQFCKDCHLGNYNHPQGYVFEHSDDLAVYGNNVAAAGCVQCHTTVPGGQNSCASCHKDGSVTNTQWHAKNFVGTHKATLAQYGNNQAAAGCTTCHGETKAQNACASCHTNGLTNGQATQWHPSSWWITHAQTTKPSDVASCNQCHSYVEPSCSKCHSGF